MIQDTQPEMKMKLHIKLIEGLVMKIMNIYGQCNCYWDGFDYHVNDGVHNYGKLILPDMIYPEREYGEVKIIGDLVDTVKEIRQDPLWIQKLNKE